jgi:ferritin-like metal-binding protein YciE
VLAAWVICPDFIKASLLPGELTMSLSDLEELFVHHVRDTFDAEKQILKALPKMIKGANSPELQAAFEKHLEETKVHVERLEQIFELLEKPARGKKCAGMAGLVEEGAELLEEKAEPATLDAGLIAAAQKVEHYEIAAYGTMATYADMLGIKDAAKLLKQTLAEEEKTDKALTELAMSINFEADQEGTEENDKSSDRRRASASR